MAQSLSAAGQIGRMPRVAMVTGAGSGIGRAVARSLAAAGWIVALVGRTRSSLDETNEAIALAGGEACSMVADVTSQPSVVDAFGKLVSAYGRLDLLFNNAGTNVGAATIDELTLDDWNTVLNTNLTGAFLCAREAFRIMRTQQPQGGRIINNGSISAYVPRPGSAPYTASKHAILGLTKSISLDGRAYGIACSQIDIGNAATEMTAQMSRGVAQADGQVRPEATMPLDSVASAVTLMADLPLDSNVQFMTLMATSMPYIGRG
ncbi:MAG TPA: SDR family oxidoreductase [Micromonosporaceae bacterium]|jgi:NAD(P)-dependent dehydrogenase (short-subunit alcohol dehydrogenase family)|nr:SDR family oxidoreductase [Micromonosporaceae bacterium]